jgi:hypothetical protein
VFHYKIQDIPCAASQITFIAGIFDAVKVPNVPFAYAFCPIGKSGKLISNCMEFFGKAFNFYNWYLNSSNGNLKSISSLSSEVFPFPSYYMIFVKDLPKTFVSSANLTLLSSDLLCDAGEIDQSIDSRKVLCRALSEQYFTLRIDLKSPNDSWIIKGITGYLSELQLRTFHGNNDYRLKIKRDIERLVQLENSENLYVPSLANLAGYLNDHAGKLNPVDFQSLQEIFALKSRLIFVLLERKIERNFLQKLLSHIYSETLIMRDNRDGFSCQLFLKLIKRLTGKDLKSFTDQLIFNSGCPMFSLNFFHNRKRSMIEFEMASLRRLGSFKFSGNLTVRIVESETISHEHVVHIDEMTTKFDVPFHSKAKRPRKKKNPVVSTHHDSQDEDADETAKKGSLEEDESLNETLVSPISWIRIDPDMEWLAQFSLAQPDIMWIEALENDRDVVAQWDAVKALPRVSSTSESACFALERFINDWKAFWAVRVEAVNSIALIGASLQESPVRLLGARKLIEMFNKKFGHPNPSLISYPKANSFEIFPNYFLQCAIPRGISLAISTALESCSADCGPLEPFLAFFASVLKYNDNSANNGYSDSEYLATLIRCGTSAFARIQNDECVMQRFEGLLSAFTDQLCRYAKLELFLPSFRNVVMCAVLEACVAISPEREFLSASVFHGFLEPSNNTQVRLDTFRYFSANFRALSNPNRAFELLKRVCGDFSVEFRHLAASDVSNFELVQFLLNCMDDSDDTTPFSKVEFKNWLKSQFTADPVTLLKLVSFVSVLEDSSSTANEDSQTASAPTKLKITLNLGSAPEAPSSSSTVVTAASIDDDDDIWLKELTGDAQSERPTSNAASSAVNEREALQRVWKVIWSNYDSIPFRYPVDPSVPGYYAIIKTPMDLSRVRDRISTLPNFLMDLRLIFQNCFTFNQPDSLIYDQAKRLRNLTINELKTVFPRDKKLIKRVLKTAQEDSNLLQSINKTLQDHDEDVFTTNTANPVKSPKLIPKLSFKLPQKTESSSGGISPSDLQKMKNILQRLSKHRHAYFFLEPVDPIALNIPTYFDIIKTPMDLSTIKTKLPSYKVPEEFAHDCRLVFSNCKTFNSPETLVYQIAVEMEHAFEADWTKFNLPSSPKKQQNAPITETQPSEVPKIKLSLNFGNLKKE